MTAPTYPGVHMVEGSSGVRPITGASTSTAAFLGVAERGPIEIPQRILNFTEYQTVFGGFIARSWLAHAVYQFFRNGGSICYVGRVVGEGADHAETTLDDRSKPATGTLTIRAASPGDWGNELRVRVESAHTRDPANGFDLLVYTSGGPDAEPAERFADLSMDPASPRHVATVVNTASTLVRVTVLRDGNATEGYLQGGPLAASGPLLGADRRTLRISINGDAFHDVTLSVADADLSDPDKVREALENAIRALGSAGAPVLPGVPAAAYTGAAVTLQDRALRITSGHAGVDSGVAVAPARDLATNVLGDLRLDRDTAAVTGAAVLRPADTDEHPTLLSDGTDGATAHSQDYVRALSMLDTVRDVSLLAIPGVGDPTVVGAAMAYCRDTRPLSDLFLIADVAADDVDLDDAVEWQTNGSISPNSYGALYFPWLLVPDPAGGTQPVLSPPSGFVAGIYARTDATRGVWKTPAGTEAGVSGALGLLTEVTDIEHGILNAAPVSVSVIRRFPGTGIVLWGGRTMSASSEWRYTAVRRTAIFLRVSIVNGIQWAVFEPNDEPLWSQLRLDLTAFMTTLFRQGAFAGRTPADAFFVKVDSETTPPADVARGVVNINVGFAPLRPAEFVVVKLSQSAGQAGS